MNVIIFNNIRNSSFDCDYYFSPRRERRTVLNSFVPSNEETIYSDRITAIRNIFDRIGETTQIPNILNLFLQEMNTMREFNSQDELLRFLSYNIKDLVNRSILFTATRQGARFWNSIHNLYIEQFDREVRNNRALRNTFI